MVAIISTGELSTLGTYRKLAAALTGENSPATKMLDEKIQEQGEEAEVTQHESQMLMLIIQMGIGSKASLDSQSDDMGQNTSSCE